MDLKQITEEPTNYYYTMGYLQTEVNKAIKFMANIRVRR